MMQAQLLALDTMESPVRSASKKEHAGWSCEAIGNWWNPADCKASTVSIRILHWNSKAVKPLNLKNCRAKSIKKTFQHHALDKYFSPVAGSIETLQGTHSFPGAVYVRFCTCHSLILIWQDHAGHRMDMDRDGWSALRQGDFKIL